MKILVVGDLHMRFELPYASAFKDGRTEEWGNVKKVILDTAKDCDAVVLLGDVVNLRHNHSSVLTEFIEFLKALGDKEIHILVGNHNRYGKDTSLDFLDKIKHKNWFIYSTPQVVSIMGTVAMMIPYTTPALLNVETKEEGVKRIIKNFPSEKIPLAFAHHAITGAESHGVSMDMFNEIILPKEEMEKHFGHSFYGHLHQKQILSSQVIGAGNVFTNEVGDHFKSIWTWEDGIVTEIPLPVRGIYKVEVDKTMSLGEIPNNSIVKAYVRDREIDVNIVKEHLGRFDAFILVEQYPSERSKVHFEKGGLDLSVDSLLKLYADARKLSYEDLHEGFEIIKN